MRQINLEALPFPSGLQLCLLTGIPLNCPSKLSLSSAANFSAWAVEMGQGLQGQGQRGHTSAHMVLPLPVHLSHFPEWWSEVLSCDTTMALVFLLDTLT